MKVVILQSNYNMARSEVDFKLSNLKQKERELLDFRERILTAIAFHFGKDSEQYVSAGGVRKSERKRSRLKMISSDQMNAN